MTYLGLRPRAMLLALHILVLAALAAPAPATAMQILDAADHAELAAEISATKVNRIALHGDRIVKVVRAPDGFAVEHDARSGDLYLRPSAPATSGDRAGEPVTLFIGTEKGFTYRLTLTPADRDSAQILIRNARAVGGTAAARASAADTHIAALVRLVRAVARREVLPGYRIETGPARTPIRANGPSADGLTLIETWRGPRFATLVFEAARPASEDADRAWPGPRSGLADLAGTIEETLDAGRVAALWLAAPGTGPSGARLSVAIVDLGAGASR